MPKKKKKEPQFTDLTWNDLEKWAGSKIVARGRNYQRNGYVSDLAKTEEGILVAWVKGTRRYATKVAMGDDGLPESNCTCPYGDNCKHGVATVVEYLQRVNDNKRISKAETTDERFGLIEEEKTDLDNLFPDEEEPAGDIDTEVELFLKDKTKAQLLDLIRDIAREHPEVARELADRRQVTSGDVKNISVRLRREIRNLGEEPGWRDYWHDEGFTPDFSGIRKKLEALLDEGYADEVLAVGKELISTGLRLAEESHDEGETAMEVSECMPVLVKALNNSSLAIPDKLNWALDAVFKDPFDVCEDFTAFLRRRHPKSAWNILSNQLLKRLSSMKTGKAGDYERRYSRDYLSNWTIHALEQAGRKTEIIPLCEREAKKTGSYDRLVTRLISAKRYQEAEEWIHKGILATDSNLPGIASALRDKLREIRSREKNWPVVAAMQADDFLRSPSEKTFMDCKKACGKIKAWPSVRNCLLKFLETGQAPWEQKGWPLPASGLRVDTKDSRQQFPKLENLIDIAILEKDPARVLHWYDQLPKKRFGWYGFDKDRIAEAVKTHAPDRAVAIWKKKAEDLIDRVQPRAYQEACRFLRKAGAIMTAQKKGGEWNKYLQELREHHARKRRLMEVLDSLEKRPIVTKGRKK